MTDLELLESWKTGDETAFDTLCGRHREHVRHYVANRFPAADADAVTGRVFGRFAQEGRGLKRGQYVECYLFGEASKR